MAGMSKIIYYIVLSYIILIIIATCVNAGYTKAVFSTYGGYSTSGTNHKSDLGKNFITKNIYRGVGVNVKRNYENKIKEKKVKEREH
jgi:hypothetical protein